MSSFTRANARLHAPRHAQRRASIPCIGWTLTAGTVVLFMISCASEPALTETHVTPSKPVDQSVATAPLAESAPLVEPEAGDLGEPHDTPQSVFLLTRESSYFGDGSLDTYRTIVYSETGTERLEQILYSADGDVIETRVYATRHDRTEEVRILDARGATVTTWTRRFDPDGRLVEETQRDADGEVQTRSMHTYDEHGRLSELEVYSTFAGPMGSTVFIYEGELRVRAESLGPNGELEEFFLYEYDADDRLVRRTHSTASGRVLGHIVYAFAEDMVVHETFFRANGSVLRSAEFEYDDAGNRVVERHFDHAGTLRETIRREFIAREIGD